MKTKSVIEPHPAETTAGVFGGFTSGAISFIEAVGNAATGAWLKVSAWVVARARACFSWLDRHDGVWGVVRGIVGGRRNTPPANPA
jgi:hypothetical protein